MQTDITTAARRLLASACRQGHKPSQTGMVLAHCSLRQWNLRQWNLRQCNLRQCNLRRAVFNCTAGIAAMFLVSGCTLSSPFGALESEPEIITGSVTAPVKDEGIDPTDAEAIKLAVAAAEAGAATDGTTAPAVPEGGTHLLAWNNPQTGNSGTITAIEEFAGSHGQSCRKFQTTIDSFMGISLYKGETCELRKGAWVLSWFIRATGG